MARIIEALNEYITNKDFLTKVECIAKCSSLKPFANIIGHFFDQECIYCHKPLNKGKRITAVDHFILWSFCQQYLLVDVSFPENKELLQSLLMDRIPRTSKCKIIDYHVNY